jgi:formyl-CoA transferase
MSVTGQPGGGPMRVGCAVADVGAGLLAAIGILTALYERETSGEGQWVQSNLLQAGIQLLDFQAARFTMMGDVPGQVGNDHPTSMPTSAYTTKDGHMNVAASGVKMWRLVCDAVGVPELFDHPDFRTAEARAKNRKGLNEALNRGFAKKTSAEWVDILNKAGVPCGPIYSMDKVFTDPQVMHVKAAMEVTHPKLGKLRLINQPVTLSRTPAKLLTATPERGEHTEEVLSELGLEVKDIKRLKSEGIV